MTEFPKSATPVVLIVENHDDTRLLLRLMLEMRGCSVVEAKNGETAISLVNFVQPDLILIDANLPLLDGLSVIRYIRQQASRRQMPIVAVTCNLTPKFQEEAFAAGCNYCLVKPIDFEVFVNLLAQLLTRKSKLTTLPVPESKYSLMLRPNG